MEALKEIGLALVILGLFWMIVKILRNERGQRKAQERGWEKEAAEREIRKQEEEKRRRREEYEGEIKRRQEAEERREREAQRRGEAGERFLVNFLRRRLGPGYRILTDIYLRGEDRKVTQIDCIVISSGGIFVIEVKNWACVVWGQAEEAYWTLVYKDGSKRRVRNPRKQNEWHTWAVERRVGTLYMYVQSVIAFGDDTKFGLERPADVMWIRDVPYYIQKVDREGILPALEESTKEYLAGWLRELSASISPEEKAEHIERQRVREYEEF